MKFQRSVIGKAKEMKRLGWTNSAIASALGMGKRTVVRHTAWLGPRRLIGVRRVLPSGASEMTAVKAGIHAYLVADGNTKQASLVEMRAIEESAWSFGTLTRFF